MAMKRAFLVTLAAMLLLGCGASSRRISLGSTVIATTTPIQLDRTSIPIAASRDGRRLVLVSGWDSKVATFKVIDVDTQRVLGTKLVRGSAAGGATMFTRDGREVCMSADEGYVAWDYAADKTQLLSHRPEAHEGGFELLGHSGWNFDRSIAIHYPFEGFHGPQFDAWAKDLIPQIKVKGKRAVTKVTLEPGQVALPRGVTLSIPSTERAGFDQFGSAWVGHPGRWTRIDHNGAVTRGIARAPALTQDQTRVRGSLHLVARRQEMAFRGAKSYVTCIWLTHDRAVPFTRIVKGKVIRVNEPYRAAVVFAGADVTEYGFLPRRDLIYVVSSFGSYLIPFETKPANPDRE